MIEETLTVLRGDTDKYGNPNKEAHGTAKGIFAWGSGPRANRNVKGNSSTVVTELYVKRGADVKARDRIRRANGEVYAVVGNAMWDQGHAFDGFDFGYMVFQVEAVNG